jgi:HK97 gp10 family phage protein
MGIQTQGIAETQASLERLGDEIREKLVLRAARDAGNVIRDAMRESAPVLAERNPGSDALEPGQLRADIRTRARLQDGVARAIIGPARYAYVARWVEYGHRLVKGSHGKQIGEVAAYPTLRPAFERSQGDALKQFESSMQTYLPEAMR